MSSTYNQSFIPINAASLEDPDHESLLKSWKNLHKHLPNTHMRTHTHGSPGVDLAGWRGRGPSHTQMLGELYPLSGHLPGWGRGGGGSSRSMEGFFQALSGQFGGLSCGLYFWNVVVPAIDKIRQENAGALFPEASRVKSVILLGEQNLLAEIPR